MFPSGWCGIPWRASGSHRTFQGHLQCLTSFSLRLHLITSAGLYQSIEYKRSVEGSKGLNNEDATCVAVVDNSKSIYRPTVQQLIVLFIFHSENVKLTFLKETVIPPPMCGYEIEFSQPTVAVDFSAHNFKELCVISHAGNAHFFHLTDGETDGKSQDPDLKILKREGRRYRPVFQSTASIQCNHFAEFYHWRYVNQTTLVACDEKKLFIFRLDDQTLQVR